ncbi:hypothetical protein ABPG72_014677 [Tetrahymena utriculariae]
MQNTLQNQQEEEEKYQNVNLIHNQLDYIQGQSIFGRLFMLNVVRIAFIIKNALKSGIKLNFNHVPKFMEDQKVEYNSKYFTENLEKALQKSKLTVMISLFFHLKYLYFKTSHQKFGFAYSLFSEKRS